MISTTMRRSNSSRPHEKLLSLNPHHIGRSMKCSAHQADAVAVCSYCGRAICPDCIDKVQAARPQAANTSGPPLPAASSRLVCSDSCAAALARTDELLQQLATMNRQLLRQSIRNARASAFYCYLGGGLSAGASVVAWFILPSTFLILFTAACAVVLILSGIWYGKGARRGTA